MLIDEIKVSRIDMEWCADPLEYVVCATAREARGDSRLRRHGGVKRIAEDLARPRQVFNAGTKLEKQGVFMTTKNLKLKSVPGWVVSVAWLPLLLTTAGVVIEEVRQGFRNPPGGADFILWPFLAWTNFAEAWRSRTHDRQELQ